MSFNGLLLMIWGYYLISHDKQVSIVCEFPLIIKPLKEIKSLCLKLGGMPDK